MSPNAYHKAIQYLAIREHSYLELYRKLSQKKYTPSEIEEALLALIEENLLSDQRYGESYVRAKVKKGYGSIRIRHELKAKGLSDAQIDLAFKVNDIDWENVIEEVWSKKYSESANNDNAAEKAKRWRFFQYRGFTQAQISVLFRRMSEKLSVVSG